MKPVARLRSTSSALSTPNAEVTTTTGRSRDAAVDLVQQLQTRHLRHLHVGDPAVEVSA